MQTLNIINLKNLERIQKIEKTLVGKSTSELISLVQVGLQRMPEIPNEGKDYLESALNLPENHPIYLGRAGYRLIEKREGENYALSLIGLRTPKTFFEKLRYFISGIPFALESSN